MICNVCRDCIYYLVTVPPDEHHGQSQQYHHTESATFLAAIQDGCYICYKYYVSRNINPSRSILDVWEGIKPIVFRGRRISEEASSLKWSFRISPENVHDDDLVSTLFEVYEVDKDRLQDLILPSTYIAPLRTNDDAAIDLVRNWLSICCHTHEQCHTVRRSHPTRLMDLQPSLLGKEFWQLVDTRVQPVTGDYVTLSHRWGKCLPTRLTLNCEDRMLKGSQVSELSPLYQEAIYIAKALGIRYLWIDSICVLQNQIDTQVEACKMADVFENALFNLSALAADPDTMFTSRRADVYQPSARLLFSREIDGRSMIINDPDSMKDDVDRAPLSQRAWVFQEQLLPRRTVFFGQRQIMWHCICSSASETHPLLKLPDQDVLHPWDHLNPPYYQSFRSSKMAAMRRKSSVISDSSSSTGRPKLQSFSPASSTSSVFLEEEDQTGQEWREFVEKYSRCQLNHFEDKPIAMNGTAIRSGEQRHGSYLCGLWEDSLHQDLMWQVLGKFGDSEAAARKRQPHYIGPTWSWFSVDGGVLFRRTVLDDHEVVSRPTLHLTDYHIETVLGSDNKFGSVSSAWLHLRVPMLQMVHDWVRGFGFRVLRTDSADLSHEKQVPMELASAIKARSPRKESRRFSISLTSDQRPADHSASAAPKDEDFHAIFLQSSLSKSAPPNMSAELQGLIVTKTPPAAYKILVPMHLKDKAYFRYCSFTITFPLASLDAKPNWMPASWDLWDDQMTCPKPCFPMDAEFLDDVFLF